MSAANPTRVEINEVLDEIEGYVRSTGSTIAQEVSTQSEAGVPLLGYVVQHGDHQYELVAAVGEPGMNLRYGFNLIETIAAERAQAANMETVSEAQEGELIQQATADLRASVEDPAARKEIQSRLREQLMEPPLAPDIMADGEFAYGFSLADDIYPFHDELTVTEFSDRAQRLVTVAWNAQAYLVDAYNVDQLLDEPTQDTELADRGVQ